MHLKRWITALVLLPLLIFLIIRGDAWFGVFVCLVGFLGVLEYYRIIFKSESRIIPGPIPLIGLALTPLMLWTAHRFTPELTVCVLVLNLLLCAAVSLALFKSDPEVLPQIAKQVQGLVYVPLLLAFALLIRNGADGAKWLFFILAIVFAGDVGAYYAGSYLGKHKLCPSISPGKTWEGALGGILANLLVGGIAQALFFPRLLWHESLIFYVLLGIAGQVGDLFESEFKRAADVKDSGRILPGHGGVLDRIDALLFALPVAYFFKKFILWV